MRAVILAGGRGTRLAPYTAALPKSLMPIGEMPILELLIRQLQRYGIGQITLAVGHLAELIMAYFGDGTKFGVEIQYSREERALGTAGPLGLLADLDERFLVMNGDLLTDLDFRAFLEWHREQGAMATIGIYEREVLIDLGVIRLDGSNRISDYIEKPVYRYHASIGVYALEPAVLKYIPPGRPFDLPDLVRALLARGHGVVGYLHRGYWLDIGRREDYEQAQADFGRMRARLLGETVG